MDELDATIEELAKKISLKYGIFESMIYTGIMSNKGDIRIWLKNNKAKINRILKKL